MWPKTRRFICGPDDKLALVTRVRLLGSSLPGPGPLGQFQFGLKPDNSEPLLTLFVSPRASDSGLSYTHWVRNGLTMAANDRSLNLTTLYWSQIYNTLQLSCFATY